MEIHIWNIVQDGAEFYEDSTGDCVYQSSLVFKDFDITMAELARKQFLEYVNVNFPNRTVNFV